MVARDRFEFAGDAHYAVYVTDSEKFWDKYERLYRGDRQGITKIFTLAAAASFRDQFELTPDAIIADPVKFGFPARRPDNKSKLAVDTPKGIDGPE